MDIAAITSAVSALFSVTEKALSVIERLRFKPELKGSELEEAKVEIEEIRKKLENLRQMGGLLPTYITFYKGSSDLHITCNKLEEFITTNQSALLKEEDSIKYQLLWSILLTNFRAVTAARTKHVLVIKRRIPYLDINDAKDIESLVDAFETQYDQAKARIQDKNVTALINNTTEMARLASEISSIFKSSIDNMVSSLLMVER